MRQPVHEYVGGLNLNNAPFVYFDVISDNGAVPNVVQVSLAAFERVRSESGNRVENVPVAHLRCNVPAARGLIAALQEAIELAEKPPVSPAVE
ncbi:MAG: hypothetical protein AAF408_14905 [Pseudomonadota bacterium]